MKGFAYFLFVALLAPAFIGCMADDADLPRSAILQLFNRPFKEITPELCDLRALGYSHVHVSPPEKSHDSEDWWGRYQPIDYRVIEGPLGNERDFTDMTEEAKRCGIVIIADAVLNQMAGLGLSSSDLYYPPGCDRAAPLDSGGNSCLVEPKNFHREEECIGGSIDRCKELCGRMYSDDPRDAMPDLATGQCTNGDVDIWAQNYDPHVLKVAKDYLIMLERLGAHGFRIDAAKHMHPRFLYDLLTDPAVRSGTSYAYGESIASRVSDPGLAEYRHIPDFDFMDFPLLSSMLEAFRYGGNLGMLEKITGTAGALDATSSISFVCNHDVWGNKNWTYWRFSDYQDELLAHIFVLGRGEGLPYIYSERSDGPSVDHRYFNFHQRNEPKRMLAFHTRTIGEPILPKWKDNNHLAFARGTRGFVAINKSGSEWDVREIPNLGLPDGRYVDALNGNACAINGGRIQSSVPGRWGIMLLPAGECQNNDCSLRSGAAEAAGVREEL